MEISQWEVPDFFLKLAFHGNKTVTQSLCSYHILMTQSFDSNMV